MADILIPNMEMPKRCLDCRFCDDNGDYPLCIITETQKGYTFIEKDIRMDDCPLIALPEHGDLIDRSALLKQFEHDTSRPTGYEVVTRIMNAPVVVEASR